MYEKTPQEDTFYILKKDGRKIDFSLEAEGLRKLGLLWKLIRNGLLEKGSILLWDEPEANLNPELYPLVANILVGLQKNRVQIFVATQGDFMPRMKWSDLNSMQLGRYGEYYAKMEFTSYGYDVYVIPAMAWQNLNSALTYRKYDKPGQSNKPEWGISCAVKNLPLLDQYRAEKYFGQSNTPQQVNLL